MEHTIRYVGLDVDDTQYHGSAFHQPTGAEGALQNRIGAGPAQHGHFEGRFDIP